jgi:hypothetical protein
VQIPGPLEDRLREAEAALYGLAQNIMRIILAIPLWLISRLGLLWTLPVMTGFLGKF